VEVVAGTMPLPVAVELAMIARFYERFGDHAVNLARRISTLAPAVHGQAPDGEADGSEV
jgi:phosphate uptake regulator